MTPLRILALLSEPLIDERGEPVPRLDLHAAAERVRQQLGAIQRAAELRFVPAIANDVLDALREHGPFDLVHFYGHGNKGSLAFEDGRGGAFPMDAKRLRGLLAPDGRPPAVALLSACRSGSMAEALLASGVAHVVAIDSDETVLDVAARAFAGQFYPALLSGRSVRQAFEYGLAAVWSDTDVNRACRYLAEQRPGLGELAAAFDAPNAAELLARLEVLKFRLLPEPPDGQPDPHQAAPLQGMAGTLEAHDLPEPPATIAARPEYFTGRERELHAVIDSVLDHRLTLVLGTGGMGKSELCREAGRWFAARGRFPGGITFIPLGALNVARDARTAIAAALKLDARQAETLEQFARLLPRDALIILDELDTLVQEDRAATRELAQALHDHSPARILISSRYATGVTGERQYPLKRLPPDAARTLFLELAIQPDQALRGSEQELEEVLKFLDGFPRAIVLAAKQVQQAAPELRWLLEDLLKSREEVLSDPAIPKEELKDGDSVLSTLNSSFRRLAARDPDAAAFFPYMSLFPAGIGEEGLRAIFGAQARLIRPVLDFALAEVAPPLDYYYLPAPVRSYAGRRLPDNAIASIGNRALAHYANVAINYDNRITRGQIELGVALFGVEFANFEAFLDWGYAHETSEADPPVSHSARITGLFQNFFVLADPGRTQMARYQKALEAARRIGDQFGEANVLKAIGDVQNFRKEMDAALSSYNEALKLFRAVGARLGEANVRMSTGDLYLSQQNWLEAIQNYEAALPVYRAIEAKLGQANTLIDLGKAYFETGQREKGIASVAEAGDLFAKIGSPTWAIRAYRRLAEMLKQVGRTAEAEQILDQIGDSSPNSADETQRVFAQFLSDVIAGARGDAEAGPRAYQQAQVYQSAPDSSDGLRAIARACQRILEGLRGKEVMEGLPAEIEPLIQDLLKQIESA